MDLEEQITRLLADSGKVREPDCIALSSALQSLKLEERRVARGLLAALVLRCPESVTDDEVRAFLQGIEPSEISASTPLIEGLAAFLPQTLNFGANTDLRQIVLATLVGWAPERCCVEDFLSAAPTPTDTEAQDRFLAEIVETWVWRSKDAADLQKLYALEKEMEKAPRWRFTRELIRRRIEGGPGRSPAGRKRRLLIVQNLQIGQGDEILRAGTLIAMLLAREPKATLDFVTRRTYLFDHPRIVCHAIEDEENMRALLEQGHDGYVWFDEIHAPEVRFLSWLPAAISNKAAESDLVLEAATQNNHLILRRATVDGVDVRPRLIGPRGVVDAFDSLQKTALLLDLPWLREGCGTYSEPFVGAPSPEASRRLRELRGGSCRPLAVVQPFGGASEIKGYTRRQTSELAAQFDALVDEGFQVLVLPTGTPWGSRQVIEDVFVECSARTRPHRLIAPDAEDERLSERNDLDPADRVMRLYKYFLASADLVVSVEGWTAHLATLLERPVRLVLRAGSFSSDWYPRGAVWADRLSIANRPTEKPLIDDDARRLVFSRPCRGLLATALRGLRGPSSSASEIFLRVFESPDPELRRAAFTSSPPHLGDPAIAEALRRALRDPVAHIRAAAAGALLARKELLQDTDPSPAALRAHQAIAGQRWQEVQEIGSDAMPALAAAVDGEADFIRREARRFLQIFLRERSRARRGSAPASS